MDKIDKALSKLNAKEREKIKEVLLRIDKKDFQSLDTKKLKGRTNIFRVRKNDIRIIFSKENNLIKILTIERRGSKTY